MNQNIPKELELAAKELKSLIESADLDKIREFSKIHRAFSNQVAQDLINGHANLPMPFAVKRLIESLQDIKEGTLATTIEEQNRIMKSYIPSDQNLRVLPFYRIKLGGAWIKYYLGKSWERVLPEGMLFVHTYICPTPGNLPDHYYPVPDLSFAPRSQHQIVECQQVIKQSDGKEVFMDGLQYHNLSDAVKVNITKPPIFDK